MSLFLNVINLIAEHCVGGKSFDDTELEVGHIAHVLASVGLDIVL